MVNRVIFLTLMLLVFTGTLGLGAVWMRQEISQTANRSRALEDRLTDISRRMDEVNADVASAVNPDALLRQNESMRLALASPREFQVQRVSGSAELWLAAKRNREVFRVETASFAATASRQPIFRVVAASLR
jgi:frataxin-like iron-binding protein CyaY